MPDTRVYTDIRVTKGSNGELEQLRRDGSNLVLHLQTKCATTKKRGIFLQGGFFYMLTDKDLTMKYKTSNIAKKEGICS